MCFKQNLGERVDEFIEQLKIQWYKVLKWAAKRLKPWYLGVEMLCETVASYTITEIHV